MVRTVTDNPSGIIDAELGIGHSNWDEPQHLALGQRHMQRLFRTVAIEAAGTAIDLPRANQYLDVAALDFSDPLHPGRTIPGDQFLNRRVFNDALLIMQGGQVIHESYRNGMQPEDRHVLHSCTKSFSAMLVAIAAEEGRMQRERDIGHYIPELQTLPAWQGVTVQQVLDMQAGIDYSEDYTDPQAHYWRYARAAGYYPPLPAEEVLGVKAWIVQNLTERSHTPGTTFAYNSCLTNVLGMALENIYGCGLAELFEKRIYQPVGAEADGYFNTDRYGFPIAEGQLSLRLRDFARLAALLSNNGDNLVGERVLPEDFIQRITTGNAHAQQAYHAQLRDELFPQGQYKEQFWVVDPGKNQFTMLGIHGQFAWYDLDHKLLAVGFGSYPQQDGPLMMSALSNLWQGIRASQH
jgi:CubicO group peptidase (beta-lactamase class C family)